MAFVRKLSMLKSLTGQVKETVILWLKNNYY